MDIFGFSLWFFPPPSISSRFSEVIQRLSLENGGPLFDPHITLLSEISNIKQDVIDAMKKIGEQFPPVTIRLTTLGSHQSYHHALFVRADLTDELLKMNRTAASMLGITPSSYMPHLSLLYGTYPPGVEQKIIDELGLQEKVSFTVDTLHLIQSTGDEATWTEVHSVSLRGRR